MIAIILAAGEGKRLRPLTSDKPKSMVEVWGQSFLERQLSQLKKAGVENIAIVTGYCKEQIEALGITTVFNEQYDTTNMVFSLAQAKSLIKGQDKVLILYGDIAYKDSHLQSLIDSCKNTPCTVLGNLDWLSLWSSRLEDPLSDAETFIYDDKFMMKDIGKRPENLEQVQAQYMGMIKMDASYLELSLTEYLNRDHTSAMKNMYMTDFIQEAIDKGDVSVELVSGGWIEMDTIEDYKLYAERTPSDFDL